MAGKVHRRGTAHHVKRLSHGHKRPCRSAPAAPTGLDVEFLKREVHHREEWRARVTFNAVAVDVAGRALDPERYDVQLRATDASGVPITIAGHDDDVQRESVNAGETLKAVFENLSRPKTWYYQARVRTLNRIHGGKCFSAWTAWSTPTQPSSGALPGPPAPTGLTLRLDKVEGTRRFPWRASPKWNEIGTWTPTNGDPIDGVTTYQVQLAVSKDGGTNTVNIRRASQPADPTVSTTHHDFFNARGRRHYRARVRAVDQYGRIGAYSSWTAWASPGGAPNAVENLTWSNPLPGSLVARWDQPTDPTDVDRYHVKVFRQPGLVLVDEGDAGGTRWTYHIPPADRNNNHRVVVTTLEEEASLDVDDDVSVGFDVPDAAPDETSTDTANDQVWGPTDLDMDAVVAELPPAPTSDGDPPATVAGLTLVGGPGFILARWTADTATTDVVTYDVHISATTGFTVAPANLFGSVDGTAMFIRTLGDGTPLAYGTTYYVKVVAHDEDGTAAPSTQASVTTVKNITADIAANAVTVAELADNAVTQAKLADDAVGTAELAALAVTTAKVAATAITTAKIAADAVTAAQLADDAVGSEHIQALAVTSAEVAASAITTAKIAADAVTSAEIAANAVGSAELAALSVLTSKIAADAITAAQLADDAVGTEHLQNLAVTSAEVAAGAITTAKIAADAVTAGEIAANAVGTSELNALAVTSAKIAALAVTTTELAANAVTSAKLATGAVGTTHIQALAVTAAEIAANAVTTTKIIDDAINSAKIATDAVGTTEIAALAITAAKIAANTITAAKIAADTITAAEIAALAITTSELAAGAVTAAKIAADTITANEIAASAITTSELAAGSVTAAKIVADTITSAEIAALAITTSELAAGAVTAVKIAAGTITASEIAAATITGANIAADTITATQIAANAITTSELNALAVTAAKIAADSITASEIAASAITTSELASGSVTAAKIVADTITAAEIAALAITSSELAANSVIAGKILAGTIVAADIAAATITGAKIAADTITSGEIAANAITTAELNALAVTAAKIAANTITAGQIAAGTITATEIAASTITAAKIAANTITAAQIAADTITASQIAASAITASELATDSVTSAKILAGQVTAAKIAADTITASEIAASAITTSELAAGAVTAAKIFAGTITATEIAAGTITAVQMAADSIVAQNIVAGEVTAEKLAGVLDITTQMLRAGTIAGQHVELDKNGFRLYGSDGETVLIEFPTDPTKSSSFKGSVIASQLDVTGGATLRAASSIPRDGVLTLESIQQAPVAAPTLSLYYATKKTLAGYSENHRGLYYDAAGGAGGATATYITVMPNSSGTYRYVREFTASTGVLNRELDLGAGSDAYGVVRVGSYWFVLRKDSYGDKYLSRYQQSNLSSQGDVGTTSILSTCWTPGLATDGTDIFLICSDTGGDVGNVTLRGYDTTPARKSSVDLVTNVKFRPEGGPKGRVRGAVKRTEAAINGGAAVWWISVWDTAENAPDLDGVYCVKASDGTRVTGYDWEAGAGGAPDGLALGPSSVFMTLVSSSEVYTHTDWKWDSAALSNVFWGSYSWYDSAGTVHETTLSPRNSIVMRQRAGLTFSWPLIPSGGADDPNSVRTYLKQNATDPGSAFASYYRQTSGSTGTATSLTTYSTATAGVQAAAFTAGTPGKITALAGFAPLLGTGDGFMPIGALLMWPTATAPTGWLKCDGAAVSRTTYAALYAIIGTTYGVGDGSTTFNLPDLQSRYPLGAGTLAALAGNDGVAEASRTHRHGHNVGTLATGNDTGTARSVGTGAANAADKGHTHGITGTAAINTLASIPYLALHFIIKT